MPRRSLLAVLLSSSAVCAAALFACLLLALPSTVHALPSASAATSAAFVSAAVEVVPRSACLHPTTLFVAFVPINSGPEPVAVIACSGLKAIFELHPAEWSGPLTATSWMRTAGQSRIDCARPVVNQQLSQEGDKLFWTNTCNFTRGEGISRYSPLGGAGTVYSGGSSPTTAQCAESDVSNVWWNPYDQIVSSNAIKNSQYLTCDSTNPSNAALMTEPNYSGSATTFITLLTVAQCPGLSLLVQNPLNWKLFALCKNGYILSLDPDLPGGHTHSQTAKSQVTQIPVPTASGEVDVTLGASAMAIDLLDSTELLGDLIVASDQVYRLAFFGQLASSVWVTSEQCAGPSFILQDPRNQATYIACRESSSVVAVVNGEVVTVLAGGLAPADYTCPLPTGIALTVSGILVTCYEGGVVRVTIPSVLGSSSSTGTNSGAGGASGTPQVNCFPTGNACSSNNDCCAGSCRNSQCSDYVNAATDRTQQAAAALMLAGLATAMLV